MMAGQGGEAAMKSVLKRVFSPKPPKEQEHTSFPSLRTSMGQMELSESSNGYHMSDFEVLRCLGTGSFGRVNLVRHRPTQAYYAMKKLRKSEIVRLRQVEHTNAERRLLSLVEHPFIVHMVCTFQDERSLYIVMEYVCGGELFSLLRRVRVLPPFVAVYYAAQVVLAVEYLHSRDMVYRDLKPGNNQSFHEPFA